MSDKRVVLIFECKFSDSELILPWGSFFIGVHEHSAKYISFLNKNKALTLVNTLEFTLNESLKDVKLSRFTHAIITPCIIREEFDDSISFNTEFRIQHLSTSEEDANKLCNFLNNGDPNSEGDANSYYWVTKLFSPDTRFFLDLIERNQKRKNEILQRLLTN